MDRTIRHRSRLRRARVATTRILAVERSADALLIQITFNEERTVAQKQAICAALVAKLEQRLGLGPADVTINLLDGAGELVLRPRQGAARRR